MIKSDVSFTKIYILSDQGKDRCDVDRSLGIIPLLTFLTLWYVHVRVRIKG